MMIQPVDATTEIIILHAAMDGRLPATDINGGDEIDESLSKSHDMMESVNNQIDEEVVK